MAHRRQDSSGIAARMRRLAFGALAMLLAASSSAAAADAVSFKGKTVTMIIGFAAGGGTDLSGRLIAAYLGRYLPGEPTVIVQNMPGAEGMTAMNFFANQSKPDGLTLTMGSGSVADPINFRKPQVIMGSPGGAPRSGVLVTAWGIEFLGWNAKWVVGYKGTSDLFTALERGEIDMAATSSTHQIDKLLKTGKFTIVSQSGTVKDGQLMRRSDFPDAPLLPDMLAGKISDAMARKSFEYWSSLESKDKWLALPPGTPTEIVQVYRDAFVKVAQDPDFLARAKGMAEDFTPTSWQDLQSWIKTMAETPPEAIAFLAVMLHHQGVQAE